MQFLQKNRIFLLKKEITASIFIVVSILFVLAISINYQAADKVLIDDREVTSLSWSPDGKILATSSISDGNITLWDVRSGSKIRQLHRDVIGSGLGNSLAFTVDGRFLITPVAGSVPESAHAALTLWDLHDGFARQQVLGPIPQGDVNYNRAEQLFLSADGKHLAIIAHNPRISNVVLYETIGWTNRILDINKEIALSISFSPNGKRLAVGTVQGNIILFDAENCDVLRVIRTNPDSNFGVEHIAFNSDGSLVASSLPRGRYQDKVNPNSTKTILDPIRVWRTEDGSLFRSVAGDYGQILQLLWPENGYLTSLSSDRFVRLWNISHETDSIISMFSVGASPFNIQYSRDSKHLAVTSGKNVTIRALTFN